MEERKKNIKRKTKKTIKMNEIKEGKNEIKEKKKQKGKNIVCSLRRIILLYKSINKHNNILRYQC
jgi:membrane glycosyltransferase